MAQRQIQLTKAVFYMTGAIASFVAMAVAGRAVSFQLDTFEIMLFRSFIGFLLVLGFILVRGEGKNISRRHMGIHVVRNLFHFSGQNLWFFALTVIPLAQVFALEFTTPLWILILSPLILGERLSRKKISVGLIGFGGALLVAQPAMSGLSLGVISAALAAVGFAGSIVLTKKLTQSETILTVLFYMTLFQLGFGIICAGYDGDIALPSAQNLPWVILIACAGLAAHFSLTAALSLAPATLIAPIDFIRLPAIVVIGFVFYSEPVDALVILGAGIIFAANYVNILGERNPS
ncbi:MAG: DMT family transporter [Paracoccaceae bacterium]